MPPLLLGLCVCPCPACRSSSSTFLKCRRPQGTLAGPWCGWGRAAHFTLFLRLKPDTNFSSEDPPSANLQLEARVRLSDLLFPLLCALSDRAQKTFEILENGAGEVEASAGAERRSKDAPSSPRKSPRGAAGFLIAISGVEVGEARNTLAATDRTSKVAWNLRVVPEGWSQRGDPGCVEYGRVLLSKLCCSPGIGY